MFVQITMYSVQCTRTITANVFVLAEILSSAYVYIQENMGVVINYAAIYIPSSNNWNCEGLKVTLDHIQTSGVHHKESRTTDVSAYNRTLISLSLDR